MNKILQYSNGWGHLIMSIVFLIVAMLLILFPGTAPDIKGIGVGIIFTVSGAWFIPGAAKQVLNAVPSSQSNQGNP